MTLQRLKNMRKSREAGRKKRKMRMMMMVVTMTAANTSVQLLSADTVRIGAVLSRPYINSHTYLIR